MLNVICLAIVLAITVILVRISIWIWRTRVGFLRWGGVFIGVVLTAVFAAMTAVMTAGLYRLHARSAPVPDLTIADSPAQIQRGHDIADGFCGGCHSRTGTLTGGVDLGRDIPIPVGSFVSSNLTPAGQLMGWSDGQIFRAIRNGVDADGRWLFIMSLTSAGNLSDDDIESLIAYIRSTPAAGAQTPNPPDSVNPLGVVMLGAGLLPRGKPVFTGAIKAPTKGPTAEYGEYIVSYQDCRQCHGNDLSGGKGGLAPIGPGLSLVKEWRRDEFIATMRTGTDPNGHAIDGGKMPWRDIGKMDDIELAALYEYLTHLPEALGSIN
jgi:mono/diheme cytochrome c family protein